MKEINEIEYFYNEIHEKLNNIIRINDKREDEIKKYYEYLQKYINKIRKTNDLLNINKLEPLQDLKLEVKRGIKIPNIIKSSKEVKIEEYVLNINQSVKDINKCMKSIKDSIYMNSREELIEIEQFVVRRFFIYYITNLILEIQSIESEAVQAFKYNVEEQVKEIKGNRETWMFTDNAIKDTIKKNLAINTECLSNSKAIMECIINIQKNELIKESLILNFNNNDAIKQNIKNNEGILKLNDKIDEILFSVIEFLTEIDLGKFSDYFLDIEVYKNIVDLLSYEEIIIEPLYRLDLNKCSTLEVEYTDDIEKDFLIKEVYRNGYIKDNKVIKRAMVNVYRYKDENEEI